MTVLSEAEKKHIVMLLAAFETPTAVVARMKADAGVEIDRSQVIRYDPTKASFEGGDRWRTIFDTARQAYLEAVEAVPIAHRGYRLNQLQKVHEHCMRVGNLSLAMATLRQAAEETGGALTNELKMQVSRPVDSLTAEERRAAFEELIRKTLETTTFESEVSAPLAVV
jgi:hypothetical protein